MKELEPHCCGGQCKPAIEQVQPRKCCTMPHEGCAESDEYKDYVKTTEKKKSYRQDKLDSLLGEMKSI